MKRILCAVLAAVIFAPAFAQPQSIIGLIARNETALLSHDDQIAAYDAEQAVLAQSWRTTGYDWKGPNGAYGTIISGTSIAQDESRRQCRRFIHIVHHARDGGVNPTYQGFVCRDHDGDWQPQPPK